MNGDLESIPLFRSIHSVWKLVIATHKLPLSEPNLRGNTLLSEELIKTDSNRIIIDVLEARKTNLFLIISRKLLMNSICAFS